MYTGSAGVSIDAQAVDSYQNIDAANRCSWLPIRLLMAPVCWFVADVYHRAPR